MVDFFKKNRVEEGAIKYFEQTESSSLKRNLRLEFMCRIRFTLHKIYEARNVLVNSYYVLKNGVTNIHRYAYGVRLCETGFDPEIKPVSVALAPTDKKDAKKGGKKEDEAPPPVTAPPIDLSKEKRTREQAETRQHRTALNGFWHVKMLFEIGRLLFWQNNFRESIRVFEMLIDTCKKHEEEYFQLLSLGFVARAKLRLGTFHPEEFETVLSRLEAAHFAD
jgi:hypothetical protein